MFCRSGSFFEKLSQIRLDTSHYVTWIPGSGVEDNQLPKGFWTSSTNFHSLSWTKLEAANSTTLKTKDSDVTHSGDLLAFLEALTMADSENSEAYCYLL